MRAPEPMEGKAYVVRRLPEGLRLYKRCGDGGPDVEITPERSRKIMDHSQTGFDTGNVGGGSSQLALAILLDAAEDLAPNSWMTAMDFHQAFNRDFLAGQQVPVGTEFKLGRHEIVHWLCRRITKQECGA